MAVRDIVLFPNDVLTTPGQDVETVDDGVRELLDDLAATMYAARGIGLAAQQVGELQRVCVIHLRSEELDSENGENGESGRDEDTGLIELVNPRVVESSSRIKWEEGCLSFPELYETIERPGQVRVEALDRNGKSFTIEGEGLLAVALQHEIDHLDGIVFTERMGRLKRRFALKRYQKILQELDKKAAEVVGS